MDVLLFILFSFHVVFVVFGLIFLIGVPRYLSDIARYLQYINTNIQGDEEEF